MTILVTGGREFADENSLWYFLDRIHKATPITKILQGGASGADACARSWAYALRIPVETHEADWALYGKSAGPRRNQKMIDMKPDIVVACPGGRGTEDCVRRAVAAGIKVIRVTSPARTCGGSDQSLPARLTENGT